MKNPAVWFEIHVENMPRARAFYEKVFGIKLTRLENPNDEMWNFPSDVNSYGSSGALVKMNGVHSGGNSTIVYFSCDDCAVEAASAASEGGRIFKEKFSIGEYGYIALVFDSEGNMIGLHSMK